MDDSIVPVLIVAGFPVLFVVLSVLFLNGKGASIIAGFNTKSDEEKGRYDKLALTRFMGKIMAALAFSMVLWVLAVIYEATWLFAVGIGLFLAIIFSAVIYTNTGDRFKDE